MTAHQFFLWLTNICLSLPSFPSSLRLLSDSCQAKVWYCTPRSGISWTLCVPVWMAGSVMAWSITRCTWCPESSWRAAPSPRLTHRSSTASSPTRTSSSPSSFRSSAPICGDWSSSGAKTTTSSVSVLVHSFPAAIVNQDLHNLGDSLT